MTITTHPESTPEALARRVTALCHSCPRIALVAVVLVIGLIRCDAPAAANDGSAPDLRVGHRVERVVVPGAAQNEPRQVDVHLWYPADPATAATLPKATYKSALHGEKLYPDLWDPLSWTVKAEIAHQGAAIDPAGGPFPVIVFSHGATNDPIDYAHTLELIASAGFVVAAPGHTTTRKTTPGSTSSTGKPRRSRRAARCSRARTGDPLHAPGGAFRSVWPTAPGTSRRCWTSFPRGSGGASTRSVRV